MPEASQAQIQNVRDCRVLANFSGPLSTGHGTMVKSLCLTNTTNIDMPNTLNETSR